MLVYNLKTLFQERYLEKRMEIDIDMNEYNLLIVVFKIRLWYFGLKLSLLFFLQQMILL